MVGLDVELLRCKSDSAYCALSFVIIISNLGFLQPSVPEIYQYQIRFSLENFARVVNYRLERKI